MEYTQEDEIVIKREFDDLWSRCKHVCKNEAEEQLIIRAFKFAKDAHKGVRRKSGEPYIVHPIAVAKIVVSEIGLGTKSVVAALLHDIVEDTEFTVQDMEHLFGPKIASMVDGLTKMAGVFNNETSQQAENFRKVLLTLSDDVRVILIKIADRLHNMRTLGSMTLAKQMKITGETIYLFAPLAGRLGLFAIKTELEDLSLKYRFPDDYYEIKRKIEESEGSRNQFIDRFVSPIRQKLIDNNIDFEISGRIKSIYSIWKKIKRKNITFDEIYDIFAIRIVFKPAQGIPEKSQCWHIYSLITDIYKPNPERIRDWVNIPKSNGYEALHCTLMGPSGVWCEVQIRSERMDEIAERGFAAHWKYKYGNTDSTGELDKWVKQIREALNNPTDDAVEFLDNFKLNLYSSEVVVFTPKGDSKSLPKGATALDFAYEIHSKIGDSAVGAKINHKMVSIFTELKNGDQVEILTSNNVHPKPEWLDKVVTAKSKSAIKYYLKKAIDNEAERGVEVFGAKMKDLGIQPSARVFRKILPAYDCKIKDEFYRKLAAGTINLDGLDEILRQNSANKITKFWSLQLSNPFKRFSSDGKDGKLVVNNSKTDDSWPNFVISQCCNPIPGDEVLGFKDLELNRVAVHKKSCRVAIKMAAEHGEMLVPIKWSSHKVLSYLSILEIRGIDRMGILSEMVQVITNELNVNIREMHIQSHDGIFEGTICLYVRSTDDLKNLMERVSQVKGIDKVRRVENQIE